MLMQLTIFWLYFAGLGLAYCFWHDNEAKTGPRVVHWFVILFWPVAIPFAFIGGFIALFRFLKEELKQGPV